jgi:hypothetical protein
LTSLEVRIGQIDAVNRQFSFHKVSRQCIVAPIGTFRRICPTFRTSWVGALDTRDGGNLGNAIGPAITGAIIGAIAWQTIHTG